MRSKTEENIKNKALQPKVLKKMNNIDSAPKSGVHWYSY